MYIGEDKSNGSNGEIRESGEVRESSKDNPNSDQEVSHRASVATLQRYKYSNHLF